MPLPVYQQQANIQFFELVFSKLTEGGIYIWKDEYLPYYKVNGKMCCKRDAYKKIKSITNKQWASQTFTIIR